MLSVSDTGRIAALLIALLVLPVVTSAEEPGGEPVPVDILDLEAPEPGTLDQTQQDFSEMVVSTATWMDAFFDDDLYRTTSNKTYLRLKVSPNVDSDGFRLNNSVDLRLQLPNTERWLFTLGGDPDEGGESEGSSLEEAEQENAGDDTKNVYMGVSTFFKRTRTRNVNTGAGVKWKFDGSAVYGSFNWVELWEFDKWDLRAAQRFRLYSDEGLEYKSTLSADWPMLHKWLYRTSASGLFKLNNPTQYYDLKLSLYHFLTTRQALHFSVRNGYRSSPHRSMYLNRIITEVEYRKQWKEWFYTSLIPFVQFNDSNDWEKNPGLRLDFSLRFGHVPKTEFQSAFDRKQRANTIRYREERDKALRESREKFQQNLQKARKATPDE
ncbi:hypothetical protein [Pseudodesulfovibrio sediminis]|uniref:Uncharacterized protein n=1 Tax=Pseudodesulfovibrio sediminis TaxID=2810563 RepID=A0ABM7P7K2_9BACT|nr:hypothetical protein [Pseudodesulfovibrio sediminis]BCS88966.1 hypothetical protein PSDVSF_22080 [Pseudodesulfovibrio sediminis]